MNAIEIKGLTKSYGAFKLDGLDLTLPCGCIMGLVGENGAGKSTTIRLMLGMARPDGGTICLRGRDGKELTRDEIGVVMDEVGITGCLTAEQLGRVMRGIYRGWDAAAYEGYIKILDIPRGKQFKDFSRGNKMKLGIAAALPWFTAFLAGATGTLIALVWYFDIKARERAKKKRGKAFTAMMVDICVCILAVCELIVNMLSRLA